VEKATRSALGLTGGGIMLDIHKEEGYRPPRQRAKLAHIKKGGGRIRSHSEMPKKGIGNQKVTLAARVRSVKVTAVRTRESLNSQAPCLTCGHSGIRGKTGENVTQERV